MIRSIILPSYEPEWLSDAGSIARSMARKREPASALVSMNGEGPVGGVWSDQPETNPIPFDPKDHEARWFRVWRDRYWTLCNAISCNAM